MTNSNDLEIKLELYKNFLIKEVIALDPVIRKQWLYTYKGIIEYTNSNKRDLSQEQIIGASIYKELINEVEEFISEEDFEGQNYNRYKSLDTTDIKYEVLYQKRLKQMKEDFPNHEWF